VWMTSYSNAWLLELYVLVSDVVLHVTRRWQFMVYSYEIDGEML
jgi:hypothetical protein